jgi:hypothetical protein
MQAKISILFYTKRAKANTQGLLPIYQRITIDGKRIETSTKIFVEQNKWSVEQSKLKGNLNLALFLILSVWLRLRCNGFQQHLLQNNNTKIFNQQLQQ